LFCGLKRPEDEAYFSPLSRRPVKGSLRESQSILAKGLDASPQDDEDEDDDDGMFLCHHG
jgi:hypothetical protein